MEVDCACMGKTQRRWFDMCARITTSASVYLAGRRYHVTAMTINALN